MSTREGLEPSRSQDSDIQDPDPQTRPLPPRPQDADAPSDQPWPPSWGQASSSWGQAPAAPDSPAPAPAGTPAWTPPAAAQGPSWTQPKGPEAQADQGPASTQPRGPEAPAGQTQPGWGQGGGGGYPTVPAWGAPPAEAGAPRDRRPSRWLAAVVAGVVLLASGYGISQALDNDTPAGAGIPTAGQAPIAATPAPSGEEPAAAVAKALLPTVVEIRHDNGLGSGFVYNRNGYILTAAHVVQGVDRVDVRLYDGTKLTGRVVGTDEVNDVAVVKVDRTGLPTAPLAVGQTVQVGQLAVAIGSPFGLNETVTAGIISATDRVLQDGREVIQTDAPINPGNSGGLLADRRGRVIGINDAIRPGDNSDGNVGIGFAIPIDLAARSAAAIVQGKQVQTGYLGVSAADPSGNQDGALVQDVVSGSPAAKAGLQAGDLVTAVDGQAVQSSGEMVARIRGHKPGDQVTITVDRNGSQTTISATLGERPGG
ncbi:MAG TPA: trypsin-like peptidase domain-containing protein [Actinomycetes bacterium]|nr:trypsin-like peptidase domain-containing protein [Actinomycetes bacterium]